MADDSEKDVIRKVKEKDVKEDIKEDGADVFAESSTQEVENLLVNPELLVEVILYFASKAGPFVKIPKIRTDSWPYF